MITLLPFALLSKVPTCHSEVKKLSQEEELLLSCLYSTCDFVLVDSTAMLHAILYDFLNYKMAAE